MMFRHPVRNLAVALFWIIAVGLSSPRRADAAWIDTWRTANPVWRGVHVLCHGNATLAELKNSLPALASAGVNVLILEVNYGFAFESHPELRSGEDVGKPEAAAFARACRDKGIRVVPQFSSLGHQSWAKTTFPLLTRYPDLDETPGKFPGNDGIYCRSWCPQNPRVNELVFPLIDEIINAFDADALHVGMDEVFLIASEHCPRCKGGDPATLFAKSVNDLHGHIVDRRRVEMLMWGDRLLDAAACGMGEWEAAKNGTHRAAQEIPKDIIICDWHYELLSKYPGKPADYLSVPYLLGKGFRVWPSGWKNIPAIEAFVDSASKHRSERLLGYLVTTWGAVRPSDLATWEPLKAGFERTKK